MYCTKCGSKNDDGSMTCGACGCAIPTNSSASVFDSEKAKEQVKATVNDAWETFRSLLTDPVGRLANAYESLGESRALGVGVAFGVAFAICIAMGLLNSPIPQVIPGVSGFIGFLKSILVGIVPFIALAAAAYIAGKAGDGTASTSSGAFTSGIALLPVGLAFFIASLISVANIEIIAFLIFFALCLHILILFSGLTKIARLSERASTLGIPLMLIGSLYLMKVIYAELFSVF